MSKKRRTFSPEFKREAASLVLDQGHTVPAASRLVDVGENAMRRRVKQLTEARSGVTPKNKALTPEQQ